MRSIAAPPSRTDKMVIEIAWLLSSAAHALLTNAIPTTSRIRMRPMPGQPPAKVEYKRRNWTHLSYPQSILNEFLTKWSPTRRSDRASFEARTWTKRGAENLQLDNSSLQSDGRGMGSV